jgi:hypothetical protein
MLDDLNVHTVLKRGGMIDGIKRLRNNVHASKTKESLYFIGTQLGMVSLEIKRNFFNEIKIKSILKKLR